MYTILMTLNIECYFFLSKFTYLQNFQDRPSSDEHWFFVLVFCFQLIGKKQVMMALRVKKYVCNQVTEN